MNLAILLENPRFATLFESAYLTKLNQRHTTQTATFQGALRFFVQEDELYDKRGGDRCYKGRFEADVEMADGSKGITTGRVSFRLMGGEDLEQILDGVDPYIIIESFPHASPMPADELLRSEAFGDLFEKACAEEICELTTEDVAVISGSGTFAVTGQSEDQIDGEFAVGCLTVVEEKETWMRHHPTE